MHTILRLPDVKRSTGLSRSTIYLRITQGTFPKPVSLGGRAVGWLEAEVQQWLQRRIEASRIESSSVGATLGATGKFEPRMFCGINSLQLQCNSPRLQFWTSWDDTGRLGNILDDPVYCICADARSSPARVRR